MSESRAPSALRLATVFRLVPVYVLLLAAVGCEPPPARPGSSPGETRATVGDEVSEHERRWPPEGSLAALEDVPREGAVQRRPSMVGPDRLVAIVPLSDAGTVLLEVLGVPAADASQLVITLRSQAEGPTLAGCDRLAFEVDGESEVLERLRYHEGPTALGAMEALEGRTTLRRLRELVGADLRIVACAEAHDIAGPGRETLAAFVADFEGMVSEATSDEPPATGASRPPP